jgi:hypothetical protein
MHYNEFRKQLGKYPVFNSNLFGHFTSRPNLLRRQVTQWCAKGLLIQLRRGLYTFNDLDRANKFSLYFLANQLYRPSYISLESALGYYGLIPEKVTQTTSVTTKKTKTFKNCFGTFSFHHLKPVIFDNFISTKDEFGNPFLIASPERAVIDFIYFRLRSIKKVSPDIFIESYRLQNTEILNKKRLKEIAAYFGKKKLSTVLQKLIQMI